MKRFLYDLFMFWGSINRRYRQIINDPTTRERSVSLGVTSIVMGIAGVALSLMFAYFAYACFGGMSGGWGINSAAAAGFAAIFIIVGGVACVVLAGGSFIYLVLASIIYAIYQLRVNRRPIGIIALVLSLILSIGCIVAVIIFLSHV